MLIDSNLVSIDDKPIGAITGDAIPLTSVLKPGRHEPVCVCIRATEKAAGGSSVTVTIQQSDSEKGSYADAASTTVPAAQLIPGRTLVFRWLPTSVDKNWIKIKVAPSGEFTAGKIFAAIVREDHLDYEDGMYIDKGKLMC